MTLNHLLITNDQRARDKGFTKAVYIEGGMEGHDALIKPDTDLDDRFMCWSLDWQEWVAVTGWNVTVEEA